jgi:hypothetical protein
MALEIISVEDLEKFRVTLIAEISELLERERKLEISKKWLKSNEVIRILKMSNSTLQYLRDTGVVPFTKFGSTIYYDRDDIHEIMYANKMKLNH